MNRLLLFETTLCLGLIVVAVGCEKKAKAQPGDTSTGPVAASVEPDMDSNNFKVDHPDALHVTRSLDFVGEFRFLGFAHFWQRVDPLQYILFGGFYLG